MHIILQSDTQIFNCRMRRVEGGRGLWIVHFFLNNLL